MRHAPSQSASGCATCATCARPPAGGAGGMMRGNDADETGMEGSRHRSRVGHGGRREEGARPGQLVEAAERREGERPCVRVELRRGRWNGSIIRRATKSDIGAPRPGRLMAIPAEPEPDPGPDPERQPRDGSIPADGVDVRRLQSSVGAPARPFGRGRHHPREKPLALVQSPASEASTQPMPSAERTTVDRTRGKWHLAPRA